MWRRGVGSLVNSLGRLTLCEGGVAQQQGALLAHQQAATLVSVRSFCSREPLQSSGAPAGRLGAPALQPGDAAAGVSTPLRRFATEQQQAAAVPQQPDGEEEESLEQIRARIFGNHIGNGLRSGRKVLRGALKGPRLMEWYPEDPCKLDLLMPDVDADRAKLKLDRLRRRGKAPPKKGQGKRSGKKKKQHQWRLRLQRLFSPRRLPMSRLFAYSVLAMVAMRFLLLSLVGPRAHTLVIYIAGYSDAEALNNVAYFMRHGIKENDGAHYLIAIEQDYYLDTVELFPTHLPSNVEIVQTQVKCYNWGTLGWVLKSRGDVGRYKKYVWLDSSVRGPFLPNYIEATGLRWHQLLTGMIDETTKLVGGTISCSGIKLNILHPTLFIPHVQGYLVATDRKGLAVLMATDSPRRAAGRRPRAARPALPRALACRGRPEAPPPAGVLACHQNYVPAVRFSEIGASEAILNAGYNIGSLMLKYRGVDWRDRHMWNCNDRMSPLFAHMYDGYDVSPLEAMFVKVRHAEVITRHPSVVAATKYEAWARQQGSVRAVSQNAFKSMAEIHLERVKAKGPHCFDAELYIAAGPVEFANHTYDQAWEHFIMFGYREGRPHRFVC
eukprot:scaffold30.g4453.t1